MATPPRIHIIIASIRAGRAGEPVARWFAALAARREDLATELIDLREWKRIRASGMRPAMRWLSLAGCSPR